LTALRRVIVDTSERLQLVGPTSLTALELMGRRLAGRGETIIDLGRFNPNLAIDPELLDIARAALSRKGAFCPARPSGVDEFRREVARWYEERFGVRLRARRAVLPTAGVKHAVGLLAQALINRGDPVGLPDPSYPLYRAAALFAGGRIVSIELKAARDFLPNLAQLDTERKRPRVLFLNYPHNPTSTPPDRPFFVELVRWARRHNVIVIHDFAYGEIYYDNEPPLSLLAVPGARQVAVELHSFSFTYNLPGLSLGFAAGHPEILAALEQAQASLAGGQSDWSLTVGTSALRAYPRIAAANNAEYVKRRRAMCTGLDRLGWTYRRPTAGGFFWVPVPRRRNDERLARRLLSRAGVLVAPGSAFGEHGEGFLRLSVNAEAERIETAFDRIGRLWPQRLRQMRQTWGPSGSRE
jgi:aspartate/methionine/tyrosine aminotransferase